MTFTLDGGGIRLANGLVLPVAEVVLLELAPEHQAAGVGITSDAGAFAAVFGRNCCSWS